jgi:hypothetical protein
MSIRKNRFTKKKYSVKSRNKNTGRYRSKISKVYNKLLKNGGDCHKRPDGSIPITPGFKYLQELRGRPKDYNSVYMCIGHGCDIEGEVLPVPANCNYITRTACGITSNRDYNLIFDFLNGKLDISSLADYETFMFEDHSSDEDLVNVIIYEFRNHTAGQPYVNNKNNTFLSLGLPAGLRKFGNAHTTGELLDGIFKLDNLKVNRHSISQLDWYLLHYKDSLFPTQEQVERCLKTDADYYHQLETNFDYSKINENLNKKFIDMMRQNFGIDYECIMDVFPGTHINYACRNICGTLKSDIEATHPFVALQRVRSGNPPFILEKKFTEEDSEFEESHGRLTQSIKQKIAKNGKKMPKL